MTNYKKKPTSAQSPGTLTSTKPTLTTHQFTEENKSTVVLISATSLANKTALLLTSNLKASDATNSLHKSRPQS